jgi:hypothetical protein
MPVTTTIESNYNRKLEVVSSGLKKELIDIQTYWHVDFRG